MNEPTLAEDTLLALEAEIARRATWDEEACVKALLDAAPLNRAAREAAGALAARLIDAARARRHEQDRLDAFLEEFGLDSQEGIALMCLAEALLRIPDGDTADELIHEKLIQGNWQQHLGHSESLFVNASTWGLLLTGKWYQLEDKITRDSARWLGRLMDRLSEPVLRQCMLQAMRIMGRQYILGTDIERALKRAPRQYGDQVLCSFDALGEGARTAADAEKHYRAYSTVIDALNGDTHTPIYQRHSISIKLSALHPRYQYSQHQRVREELLPRVLDLCRQAKAANIGLSIDAEEAERLDMALVLFRAAALHPELKDWPGLGFVLQAYQKRASTVADWLGQLARQRGAPLCVRLVKGAYWDREIKRAQQLGLADYPVFTRKMNTDLGFLACAHQLLHAGSELLFPQFATHNALTIASITQLAGERPYELQRLHGMGDLLYHEVKQSLNPAPQVRVYAPIGGHKDLLPYLVRRLLENGANSSFVNRFLDREIPTEQLATDAITRIEQNTTLRHPQIPLPANLYPDRPNSGGWDLENPAVIAQLETPGDFETQVPVIAPLIDGQAQHDSKHAGEERKNPGLLQQTVCRLHETTDEQALRALERAHVFQPQWNALGGEQRAAILSAIADAYEKNKWELIHIIRREAGRTLPDAEAEVREAIDFCHYYGLQARQHFAGPKALAGPTGESNTLQLQGRGVFLCISPWNFPLAIFTGQVVAALAAGNTVLAKPAEQTPWVAYRASELMLAAGLPKAALQLLPGDGPRLGRLLLSQGQIQGVAFTGSTETARAITQQLTQRPGPIIPFIAETGGINAMIVDSTALLEHAVDDIVRSAFHSAGQRCSALRILLVQDDIADELLTMLTGACDELRLGDPRYVAHDIGPIIDRDALQALHDYLAEAESRWPVRYRYPPEKTPDRGFYIGPHIIEVPSVSAVEKEVFGPVLHVARFKYTAWNEVVDQINGLGYGLTLGIHTRLESRAERLSQQLDVGNIYVNRNMIGAVVGVQPFGGMGLSGTGPKAGGPHYLMRFATEKAVSINTMATGGNATLLNLED